jgi:hypothetical protein
MTDPDERPVFRIKWMFSSSPDVCRSLRCDIDVSELRNGHGKGNKFMIRALGPALVLAAILVSPGVNAADPAAAPAAPAPSASAAAPAAPPAAAPPAAAPPEAAKPEQKTPEQKASEQKAAEEKASEEKQAAGDFPRSCA